MAFIDSLIYWGGTSWYPLFSVAKDRINNYTGTVNGSISNYTLSTGQFAGYFDGNSYINGFSSQLVPTSTFGVSVWVNPPVLTSGQTYTIFYSGDATETYCIYLTLTYTSATLCTVTYMIKADTVSSTSSTTIPVGAWTHVYFYNNGTNVGLYINGSSFANGTGRTLVPANHTYEAIGSRAYDNANKFLGCMKDFIVFNAAPTTSRIKKIYTATYIE